MKNCLFVGSFNPITNSHLKIAKDLLEQGIVDYLYFLPVNSKKDNLETILDRINMINLVIDNQMNCLNIYNYHKNGLFNYLILDKINKDKKITHILMGSDLFLKFKTFYKYLDILKKYKLVIIERDNIKIKNIIEKEYIDYQDNFIIINKKYLGSSSKAKEFLNEKENKYLDFKVLDYINKNNLYDEYRK